MTAELKPEAVKAALEAATPGPWYFVECCSPCGQEWLGCGVSREGEDEFVWFEHRAEQDIPTARLIAMAPTLATAYLAMAEENERLRGLLWYAWSEFNAIRARSGAPLTHEGMTTCAQTWWSEMTDAFAYAIGDEAQKPWPSPEAREALAQIGDKTNG